MTKITDLITKGTDTGFVSISGKPVRMGDKVRMCYIDPMGGIHEDQLLDKEWEVTFEYGTFALAGTYELSPLHEDAVRTTEGQSYISNYGTPNKHTNVLLMEVVTEEHTPDIDDTPTASIVGLVAPASTGKSASFNEWKDETDDSTIDMLEEEPTEELAKRYLRLTQDIGFIEIYGYGLKIDIDKMKEDAMELHKQLEERGYDVHQLWKG